MKPSYTGKEICPEISEHLNHFGQVLNVELRPEIPPLKHPSVFKVGRG